MQEGNCYICSNKVSSKFRQLNPIEICNACYQNWRKHRESKKKHS